MKSHQKRPPALQQASNKDWSGNINYQMEDLESSEEDLHKVVLGKRRNDLHSSSASSNNSQNLLFHEKSDILNLVCEEPAFHEQEFLSVKKRLFAESKNSSSS